MTIFGIYIPLPRRVLVGSKPVYHRVRGFLTITGHKPVYGWRLR